MGLTSRYLPDAGFWQGRRVLLTGHTGFKGGWLAFWLHRLGARVTGLSLAPATAPNLFEAIGLQTLCESRIGDIRDPASVREAVSAAQPEVVLHLAAQPLVRAGYRAPLDTFATNVMGTAQVLDALRDAPSARVAVMVTTDKVYRNREWIWPYREDDALGGHDPYSASKAACEAAIDSWRASYLDAQGVAVASARAGNVIGGGDWSEDRLIPDAVRAWQAGQELDVRRPDAVRPWQHVIEPLAGYLALAEALWRQPGLPRAYNFGPPPHEAASVRDVIELARTFLPGARVRYGEAPQGPHEAGLLALDTSRARSTLRIGQRFGLAEAVRRTLAWYADHAKGVPAATLCERDIEAWTRDE
ncbi:CDP-glucose 4,6-dehydratase [Bordetella sp. H567]|nr:CDP-glucose 4,6-dehydratase [Bordetella sp. H567]